MDSLNWRVELASAAERSLGRAPADLRRRLSQALDELGRDPRRKGKRVKALHGVSAGRLRYRVGDHRIIYRVADADHVVIVLGIVHRSDLGTWFRTHQ